MLLLSKAISDFLLAETGITDITGSGNIWHAKIPQQTISGSVQVQETAIFFYTYAITPNDNKSGRSEIDEQMVRVHVVGSDDTNLSNVARYIRLKLDRVLPGTYSGLYIAGSRFLNAYFEPEGNYQLEHQEYVLEFKFRVYDPDIRIPGGVLPDTPGFRGNYSEEEQVWPYSKWLDGEIIYWRTFRLTDGVNGYQNLTDFLIAETGEYVKTELNTTSLANGNRQPLVLELYDNDGETEWQVFWFAGFQNSTVTVWYTKT